MPSVDRFSPPDLDSFPGYRGIRELCELKHGDELYDVKVYIDLRRDCIFRKLKYVSIVLLDDEFGELQLDERLVPPSFEQAVIDQICDDLEREYTI